MYVSCSLTDRPTKQNKYTECIIVEYNAYSKYEYGSTNQTDERTVE